MSKSMINEAAAPYPDDRLITAHEFARHPESEYCELKRGRVVPMFPPKHRHGLLVARIVFFLQQFTSARGSGMVMAESGVQTESDPDTVRGPDASYMSAERYRKIAGTNGFPTIMPEICIEVVSPSDRWPLLRAKAVEYLTAGVQQVWIVDGEQRKVHVFAEGREEEVLEEGDALETENLLPGFRLDLKAYFSLLD